MIINDKGEYSTALRVLLISFFLGTNENFTESFAPSEERLMLIRERVTFKHRNDQK